MGVSGMGKAVVRAVGLGLILAVCAPARAATPDLDAKVNLETRMEERVAAVLREVIGDDRFVVAVTANIRTTKEQVPLATSRKKEQAKPKEPDELALPGVPVKKKFGMHRDLDEGTQLMMDKVRTDLDSIFVSLILDESLSEKTEEIAADVVVSVLGLIEGRDRLDVKRVKFERSSFRWSSLGHPPQLYWVVLVLAGTLFLLAAAKMFLNPFASLGNGLGTALASLKPGEGGGGGGTQMIETRTVFEGASGGGAPVQQQQATEVGGSEPLPFSYVTKDHVQGIRVLLDGDPDENVAIVANYLAPELASRLLELLPEERRNRVAQAWTTTHELDPAKVRELDERVRGKLDFLMGGEDKLLAVLDGASDALRASIFTAIDATDPNLGRQLRTQVMTFESLVQRLDKTGIQVLFRRTDITTLARILKSSSPDVTLKIESSLTEGALDRLKQEMDLSREFPPKRLAEEKRRIVTAVRQMLRDGTIEMEDA